MKKYKYLLFDIDDTLVDDTINRNQGFGEVLTYLKEEITKEKLEKFIKIDKQYWKERAEGKIVEPEIESLEDKVIWNRCQRFLRYFDNEISFEKAKQLNEIYMEGLKNNIVPIEGAREIMEYLYKEGYEIYIISNGVKSVIPNKLKKIGIEEFIKDIIVAEEVGYSKPRKEFFKYFIIKTKVTNKEKMLIIGDDNQKDIKGGMINNIDTCWFNPNRIAGENISTFEIDKLEQLKSIL